MTYLDLINQVLIRLREDTITAQQVDSNPFYRSIGAHVNDAKDHVENSWRWGALRGTDEIPLAPNVIEQDIPESVDNDYSIGRFMVSRTSEPGKMASVRQVPIVRMRQLYADIPAVRPGQPTDVAIVGQNPSTGNLLMSIYPKPEDDGVGGPEWTLLIDRVRHQNRLQDPEDRLLVPSLPVYTHATALASRERGELGGTPTSELFAIANSHLSDAIALDSSFYASELDWYSSDRWNETNLRYT